MSRALTSESISSLTFSEKPEFCWLKLLPRNTSCSVPRNTGPSLSLMPYSVTMLRAISVACLMSLDAPVEMSPKTMASATRPPIALAIWAFMRAVVT